VDEVSPFNLHVLGILITFVRSQDKTLRFIQLQNLKPGLLRVIPNNSRAKEGAEQSGQVVHCEPVSVTRGAKRRQKMDDASLVTSFHGSKKWKQSFQ
jgi:hypothetical protein